LRAQLLHGYRSNKTGMRHYECGGKKHWAASLGARGIVETERGLMLRDGDHA
jgi:hypothetical protein